MNDVIDLAIYSRQLVYGDRPAMLLALMDITERKRAEARLAFMAQHDGLTGLPNRSLLRQQMDDILLHTRRSAEKVAVLVLGLDNGGKTTILKSRSVTVSATNSCAASPNG